MAYFTVRTSRRRFVVEASSEVEARASAALLIVEERGESMDTTRVSRITSFDSEVAAHDAFSDMIEALGLEYVDNRRFAYVDDADGMARFAEQEADGCCGSYTDRAVIAGRLAVFGCNHGH
jgi:hypothetical protein